MCLAVPSQIIRIDKNIGTIDLEGVQRTVSLVLIDDAKVGEYVIVHAGYAIQKIDETAAEESLKILREAVGLGKMDG